MNTKPAVIDIICRARPFCNPAFSLNMPPDSYSVTDVLAVASRHPFYSDAIYPPTREELPQILANSKELGTDLQLASFPLTWKSKLSVYALWFSFLFYHY